MRFHKTYFAISIVIFIVEVLIAKFFSGGFIRNVLGDFLIVYLIFFFILSFLKITKLKLAFGVLIFAYLVEFSQYLNILKILNIKRSTTSDLILGSSFDWNDILAYTFAFLVLVIAIKSFQKYQSQNISE